MEAESKLHIQTLIKDEKLELIGSYTLDYEVSRNPFEMRKQSITHFVQSHMKGYVGPERADTIKPIADEIKKKRHQGKRCLSRRICDLCKV